MQLSSKTRYSIMAVADLAVLELDGDTIKPVNLATISERQRISLSYLEQLFSKLRKAGIVKSIKGPGGGYNLARSKNEIRLSDIRKAIDTKEQVSLCPEGLKCKKGVECNSHLLWKELSLQLDAFLSGITLDSLLSKEFIKVSIK